VAHLKLSINGFTTPSGSVVYSSVALLSAVVVPGRDVIRALVDSTAPTAGEKFALEYEKAAWAVVWVSHEGVAMEGQLHAMNRLDDRSREVAQEFANNWLAAH